MHAALYTNLACILWPDALTMISIYYAAAVHYNVSAYKLKSQ